MRLLLSVVVMLAVALVCEAGDRRKPKCDPAVAMAWANPAQPAPVVIPGPGTSPAYAQPTYTLPSYSAPAFGSSCPGGVCPAPQSYSRPGLFRR